MNEVNNPARSKTFRLITIAASGLSSFMLGVWSLKLGIGSDLIQLPAEVIGGILAGLCALSASLAALSFFAGVDQSAKYTFRENLRDKLTGVHARNAMATKIGDAATASMASGKPIFLVDIAIDRFKQLNDTLGHSQGDQLICAFGARLKDALPDGVEMGRIGASEFAVLIPDCPQIGRVDELVERLIEDMMLPYRLPSHQQLINMSVGIVAIPRDGTDAATLMRRSHIALQHARAGGMGNWAAFQPHMGTVADHRRWIESELHVAFERGDFEMHYQPELDLVTGRVVGYEALLRWPHAERGMISPAEFIPVAEETGMIGPLGEWALRKACHDAQHLPADCFVAVNISPVQFMTRDFLSLLQNVLDETGIAPHRLELEVTETAMMQDRDRAAFILDTIAEMGISVAVDDFGTGYSNLSYLIDFSFSKLKIDRSFINRLGTDPNSGAVVSTIVGLSRALGVRTIAEGVETENQVKMLQAAGCTVAQGYFFGKPSPLKVVDDRLQPARASATAYH